MPCAPTPAVARLRFSVQGGPSVPRGQGQFHTPPPPPHTHTHACTHTRPRHKKGSHPKGRNVFLKDTEAFIKWLEEAEAEAEEESEEEK